jgi:hypothetical protein
MVVGYTLIYPWLEGGVLAAGVIGQTAVNAVLIVVCYRCTASDPTDPLVLASKATEQSMDSSAGEKTDEDQTFCVYCQSLVSPQTKHCKQ